MSASWIITGGTVHTMDGSGHVAEAVAVSSDRIVAVGSADEVRALRRPTTRVTDLAGGAVLPGFCDTHMHLEKIAMELDMVLLAEARSVADVLEALRTAASSRRGEWTISYGDDHYWHERRLAERRLPNRAELDWAVPASPVFLHRGPDRAVLNTLAIDRCRELLRTLENAAWDSETGAVSGGAVAKLREAILPPEPDRRLQLLGAASRRLLSAGVTSVVDPGLPGTFDTSWELYRRARATGAVSQRVHLMNRLDYRKDFSAELLRIHSAAAFPGVGDDRLRSFAIKLILDGEFADAWIDDPQTATVRYSASELDQLIELCATRRWPLCIHVMGTAAIECVIDRVAHAAQRGLTFAPTQVSLAHVFLPSRDQLARCQRMGIAMSVQPQLAYAYAAEIARHWPDQKWVLPLRTMINSGTVVAAGSDVLPMEPLHAARVAITRCGVDGIALGAPDEALSAYQALTMYTRAAGDYVASPLQGRIVPGAPADLAGWPVDPIADACESWSSLVPDFVAVAGECVWPEDP